MSDPQKPDTAAIGRREFVVVNGFGLALMVAGLGNEPAKATSTPTEQNSAGMERPHWAHHWAALESFLTERVPMSWVVLDEKSSPKTAMLWVCVQREILINAPVEKVWPIAMDPTAWQNYIVKDLVSGTRHQEGEVMNLRHNEPGVVSGTVVARIVKIEAPTWIAWKCWAPDNDVLSNNTNHVEYFLGREGNRTHFRVSGIYQTLVKFTDEAALQADYEAGLKRVAYIYDRVTPNLERLAEAR